MTPPKAGKPTPAVPGADRPEGRRDRLTRIQQEQAVRERRRTVALWGTVSLVLLLLVAGVFVGVRQQNEARAPGGAASLAGVKSYEVKSDHVVNRVTYKQNPPVGGPHNPIWLNCATYDKEIPSEYAVHSMEHGAVWITYRPDLASDDLDTLREATPKTYAVLSPLKDLPAPVVVSSWGKQLRLKSADDPRLKEFVREYTQSSDAPEPGAACTGGTDGSRLLNAGE